MVSVRLVLSLPIIVLGLALFLWLPSLSFYYSIFGAATVFLIYASTSIFDNKVQIWQQPDDKPVKQVDFSRENDFKVSSTTASKAS